MPHAPREVLAKLKRGGVFDEVRQTGLIRPI